MKWSHALFKMRSRGEKKNHKTHVVIFIRGKVPIRTLKLTNT